MKKPIKGLWFLVSDPRSTEREFDNFASATTAAVVQSLCKECSVTLTVHADTQKAADAFGIGEEYRNDPEASAHKKLVIRVTDEGAIA